MALLLKSSIPVHSLTTSGKSFQINGPLNVMTKCLEMHIYRIKLMGQAVFGFHGNEYLYSKIIIVLKKQYIKFYQG